MTKLLYNLKKRIKMLEVQYKDNKIYSHIRKLYLIATPEERVRQTYVCDLVNKYQYSLAQMGEELSVKEGKGSVRADIVVWKSIQDKNDEKPPLIIIECKADSIHINNDDYAQGESYARITNAPFFVTHNSYETRFWRVIKDKMPGYRQEIANIPENNFTQKEIDKLLNDLVAFKEDEFATLLHKCHDIIRNMDKLDPINAFDEISKILFMKVFVERKKIQDVKSGKNVFTKDYLKQLEKDIKENPLIQAKGSALEVLFENTKQEFAKDEIFEKHEKIKLKESTVLRIIDELQKYNLSITSIDIKGIAFERFLGATLRGELGQFFTPRSVVEFMIDMINPKENEICCDPASGSGGFLIRIFSKIKNDIQQDIINQYENFKKELLDSKDESKITQKQAKILNEKYEELQKDLDNNIKGTRLYNLSNACIFGTDANDRMARTSKMNMIMHGDGHGGIHQHDGLLNINGIFENRFDVILTNPPFGARVEKAEVILEKDSNLEYDNNGMLKAKEGKKEYIEKYYKLYGKEIYQNAQKEILDNIGKPKASLFKLKPNLTSDKTEHLFINRCLDLLKPGGRLGIVLPEGVFNTPSAEYVRDFVEGRAFIRAVISLPEVFVSAKASVKPSILFLQKFSEIEQEKWNNLLRNHTQNLENDYKTEIESLQMIINYKKPKGDKKEAKAKLKTLREKIAKEAKNKTKIDFNYPIFMAEVEFAGITNTGETGESVANELIDIYEYKNGEKTLTQKGITTYFREFLKEYKIEW